MCVFVFVFVFFLILFIYLYIYLLACLRSFFFTMNKAINADTTSQHMFQNYIGEMNQDISIAFWDFMIILHNIHHICITLE